MSTQTLIKLIQGFDDDDEVFISPDLHTVRERLDKIVAVIPTLKIYEKEAITELIRRYNINKYTGKTNQLKETKS